MNDKDNIIDYGIADVDTITIAIDDAFNTDLSDITLNTTPSVKRSPFDNIFTNNTTKKSVTHDLDIDPLAAIIDIKAMGHFPDIELIKSHVPSKETVELAQNIRNYFLDKVITQKLSSNYRDSEFKRDMIKALKLSAKCVIEEPHIRLLYRMDDFYKEDTFVENLVEKYKSLEDKQTISLDKTPLIFVGSFNQYRRGCRTTHFFFETSEGYLIRLKGPTNDWLMPITQVFKHVKKLFVSGSAIPAKISFEQKFNIGELNIKYNLDHFTI